MASGLPSRVVTDYRCLSHWPPPNPPRPVRAGRRPAPPRPPTSGRTSSHSPCRPLRADGAGVCRTSVRTLGRRLGRGRDSLRRRLERRGVAPAAAVGALAVVPAARADAALVKAALAGGPIPSSLSPWVAEELAMTGKT